MRIALSIEVATSLLGSSYDYVKTVAEGSFYWRMPRGHALGLHVFAGAIGGDAPFFDRFFIGDLNLLLPRRALGINFSTLPSRNLLDTPIASHRYDDYAGRVLLEYAIPVWRRRGFVYGGDAFAAVGLLGMASPGDFLTPGPYFIDSADRSHRRPRAPPRHLHRDLHDLDRERAQPQLVLMRTPSPPPRCSPSPPCWRWRRPGAALRAPPIRPPVRSTGVGGQERAAGRQRRLAGSVRPRGAGAPDLGVLHPGADPHRAPGPGDGGAGRARGPAGGDRLRHLGREVQRPHDARPGRRAAGAGRQRRRGDLARDRARGSFRSPTRAACGRARATSLLVRGDLNPDLGGSAGRRAPLAGAAGARPAAARRRGQLLRLVRQHLRQSAHRRQRAAGAVRVAAVHVRARRPRLRPAALPESQNHEAACDSPGGSSGRSWRRCSSSRPSRSRRRPTSCR